MGNGAGLGHNGRVPSPDPISPLPAALADFVAARLARLDERCADAGASPPVGAIRDLLGRAVLVSDFVHERLLADPAQWPQREREAADPRPPSARFPAEWPLPDDAQAAQALRRWRANESVRLVLRDVGGVDPLEATLAQCTELAEVGIGRALAQLEPGFAQRLGTPRGPDGAPQRLAVIGMGKLGGAELNFSSDIDLVFAFGEAGLCDGPRGLANEDYFLRLGQRLIQMLGEVTADGFVFRVDMRLRPFGSAGRLALSLAAMEQYYQREGRDWERYAWIKARPVAGDLAVGATLVAELKPFVFRRYLDYTAFDGLREMKRLIDAEVARRELADHVKLGPGGIREIEFMVQLVQLVRGGREPALRAPALQPALAAAVAAGHFDPALADSLLAAYRFLRRVENRLQMRRDEQVHALPEDAFERARLAAGLGFADYDALLAALDAHRARVAAAFASTLDGGRAEAPVSGASHDWMTAWQALIAGASLAPAAPFGAAWPALRAYADAIRDEARLRPRVDRLLPQLLAAAALAADPDTALARALALLRAIAGRPAYLALLDEQGGARERLLSVCARSAFLAGRVTAHPLLLDDLLDTRVGRALPDAPALAAELAQRLAAAGGDAEEEFGALHELKQSTLFRLGLAWLDGRIAADELSMRLATLADVIVQRVLDLALRDTVAAHGRIAPDRAGLLVLGYGSLGGAELGFASDLDLVFVYDAGLAARSSDGARPLEGTRWFARVAQRVVHWLTTPARAGRLYEADTRLRPDGSKGLLVTSLDAYAEYQRERAWLWEHQALVRARAICGDPALAGRFATVRAQVLAQARDPAALRAEVVSMRERWRTQLDRSDARRFDLKQGRGGLVDLEFLVQARVLEGAARHPDLVAGTRTPALLRQLAAAQSLEPATTEELVAAHDALLAQALACTLDDAPRVVPRTPELAAHADAVLAAAAASGLDFNSSHLA